MDFTLMARMPTRFNTPDISRTFLINTPRVLLPQEVISIFEAVQVASEGDDPIRPDVLYSLTQLPVISVEDALKLHPRLATRTLQKYCTMARMASRQVETWLVSQGVLSIEEGGMSEELLEKELGYYKGFYEDERAAQTL